MNKGDNMQSVNLLELKKIVDRSPQSKELLEFMAKRRRDRGSISIKQLSKYTHIDEESILALVPSLTEAGIAYLKEDRVIYTASIPLIRSSVKQLNGGHKAIEGKVKLRLGSLEIEVDGCDKDTVLYLLNNLR